MSLNRKNEIMQYLRNNDIQERLTALCGNEAKKESFKASLLNIALDSNLANCSAESIIKSALNVASLKLSLNKNLGKAYIVPRKKRLGNGEYIVTS